MEMEDNETYTDGDALEVRVAGAQLQFDAERDLEQSLNTRAVAVAAAAAVLMSLLQKPILSGFNLDVSNRGHAALTACGAASVVAAAAVVLVAVLGVLRPSPRLGMTPSSMERWLKDEGMAESQQTARTELLDAAIRATKSRNEVNAQKARALGWAYGLLLTETLVTLPILATLALR